ncbi:MBL fold metallo-hydrolase [Alkalibacterium iburiense]|uniref:MBL fold metallo-hydrolase n=1 Tax=Alkalibacterium iburiense TaxID=290589 RepID=A0ABN0X9C7_9LACT
MLHFQKEGLTVFQSSIYKTTAAVIETEKAIVLSDPNWLPDEVKEIKEFILERIKHKQLIIIYTHSDFDHIIGAGAFPEATVIASEAFKENAQKDECVEQCKSFDQKYYIMRDYLHTYPSVDIVIQKDGQQVKIGDLTLTFYLSPGHTPDGLFTIVEPYGVFLAGDYLSDVEIPFIYSGYQDYLKTLGQAKHLLENCEVNVLVPGHGNVTISKNDMWERLNFSMKYVKELPDNPQLEDECRKKFSFYDGMHESHVANIKQARKEN